MTLKTKYARVKYYKDYAPFGEGYAVEIYYNNDWELDRFFSLQHCIIDKPEDEKNFIHFGIINKIRELDNLGYEISWG